MPIDELLEKFANDIMLSFVHVLNTQRAIVYGNMLSSDTVNCQALDVTISGRDLEDEAPRYDDRALELHLHPCRRFVSLLHNIAIFYNLHSLRD